jgi:Predicted membrane protein (DUF2339)
MFELIVFVAVLTNILILNNIFDKLSKINKNVDLQKDILKDIKVNEYKFLEHNPTKNDLELLKQPLIQEVKIPSQAIRFETLDSSLKTKVKTPIVDSNQTIEEDTELINDPKINDSEPNIINKSISWILDGFLIKIGGILLLLSGSWFLSIGFNNLEADGRIIAGLSTGLFLIFLGFWQMNKRLILGQVLELLGSSIVLVAILSGRFGYELNWLSPIAAFGGCLGIVLINTFIGITKNSKPIAFLSLILGYLAPFFATGADYNFYSLMTYVLIFNVGMLNVSYYRKWNFLLLPNIIFSSIYLTSNGIFETNRIVVWIFAGLFMAVFYITTIFNQIKKPLLSKLDIFNSFFATFVGFAWVNLFVDGDWKTIVIALYAILTFLISLYLFIRKSPNEFIYLQIITAFVSLIYATILLFGNQYDFTLVAVSLELTGAQFLVSMLLNKKTSIQKIIGLIQLVPLFGSTLILIFGIVSWGNIFTALILTLCTILNTFIFFEKYSETKQLEFNVFANTFGLAGFLMTIRWIWLIFEKWFGVEHARGISNLFLPSDTENIKQATMAHGSALTILTLFAIFLISRFYKPFATEQKILGYSLISFILLRLVLVEITFMDLSFKIVTFAAIGLLLTLTAFIRKEN